MKQLILTFLFLLSFSLIAQNPAVIDLLKKQSEKFTEHDQVNVLND
jgi:hypothetical protein